MHTKYLEKQYKIRGLQLKNTRFYSRFRKIYFGEIAFSTFFFLPNLVKQKGQLLFNCMSLYVQQFDLDFNARGLEFHTPLSRICTRYIEILGDSLNTR